VWSGDYRGFGGITDAVGKNNQLCMWYGPTCLWKLWLWCCSQFKMEMIDDLYQFAKFQFECGNYSGSAEYLYIVRVLVGVLIALSFWVFHITQCYFWYVMLSPHHHTTTILRPLFWDHPGEPVPEENFWTIMVQGKINRGRHTDHPARRHSVRTNQCPPPPSPFFCRPDALPVAQSTLSKHWRQLAHSD